MTEITRNSSGRLYVDGVPLSIGASACRPPVCVSNAPDAAVWHCWGDTGLYLDVLDSADQPAISVHSSAPVASWAKAKCREAIFRRGV